MGFCVFFMASFCGIAWRQWKDLTDDFAWQLYGVSASQQALGEVFIWDTFSQSFKFFTEQSTYYREFENTLIDLIDLIGFFRCRPLWFDFDSGWAKEIMTCHIHSFDGRIPGHPLNSGDKLPMTYKGFSGFIPSTVKVSVEFTCRARFWGRLMTGQNNHHVLGLFRWGLHKNLREQLGNLHFWMIQTFIAAFLKKECLVGSLQKWMGKQTTF